MALPDEPVRCSGNCPYYHPVQGSCDNALRPAIATYLREHSEASCPVYEAVRSGE